ncbi:MAG TPA: hypothetical protein VEZ20_07505 [Allosphingosinicella sp.]|nr:hypothetical protein [Allosphingosinicella sp.]
MAAEKAGTAAVSGDPARAAEAHRALTGDSSIQFDLPAYVPSKPPASSRWLADLFSGTAPLFQVLFWIVVALAAIALVYALARWVEGGGLGFLRRRGRAPAPEAESWTIAEAPARALLADADRVAGAGNYSEAAHLLLCRSIEEIERRRPALVRPALTSRDIAGAPQLPQGPRGAFARIAMAVESSLFGGRRLDERDWLNCRAAYEEFALASEWSR